MTRLGRYEIHGLLGAGAAGSVYRARDTVLDRDVAIKTIITGAGRDPETLERFYREARACARLRHPRIVTIYDLGECEDAVYIVMELLEGMDWRRVISERREIPLDARVELAVQVAEGLAHAHAHGIIHRDIKPGNLFLQDDGSAKILDFGVARVASSELTRAGSALGTLEYMAPEQIAGQVCDVRSDLFSACAVFFELFAYAHPFGRRNAARRIVSEAPAALGELCPGAPLSLERAVANGLDKDPTKRYQSGTELAAALRATLGDIRRHPASEPREVTESALNALRRRAEELARRDPAACVAFVNSLGKRQRADAVITSHWAASEARLREGKMPEPPPPSQRDEQRTPKPTAPSEPLRTVLKPLTRTALPPGPTPALGRTQRRALVGAAVAVSVTALFIALNVKGRAARAPALARVAVQAAEARILAAPEPAAPVVITVPQGTRLNVVRLPDTPREEWVNVQYVPGTRSYPLGYIRAAEVGEWSSEKPESVLHLLKVFAPGPSASMDQLQAHLEKWTQFLERYAITPQGPEANFEKAKVHLALARMTRQAGRPPAEWQAHLDAASGQLAMALANQDLGPRVADARRQLNELRESSESVLDLRR